jgi:hypothetical protein
MVLYDGEEGYWGLDPISWLASNAGYFTRYVCICPVREQPFGVGGVRCLIQQMVSVAGEVTTKEGP